MLLAGPVLRLRPVQIFDWPIFARCYFDWPPDALGYFSSYRAQRECDVAVARNRSVTMPLTPESAWQQTLLIYTDAQPDGVGLHRAVADGTTVRVLNQVLVPECRGLGYMEELEAILQRYAFEDLGAERVDFDIIEASTAALAHVANRAKYKLTGTAEGVVGPLVTGNITRDGWESWIAKNPGETRLATAPAELQTQVVGAKTVGP